MRKYLTTFLILFLIVSLIFLIIGCTKKKYSITEYSITGGAWINNAAGQSEIIRGLEVALCDESKRAELMKIRDSKWEKEWLKVSESPGIEKSAWANYWGYKILPLEEMNSFVSKNAVKVATTNIDGKYTISNIPKGSYFLYAPYVTKFSKCYWVIPVNLEANQINIDINNSNIQEVYNNQN